MRLSEQKVSESSDTLEISMYQAETKPDTFSTENKSMSHFANMQNDTMTG